MEAAGILPADSADSLRSLGSISVSTDMAGWSSSTNNFNMNIGEINTTITNLQDYAGAAAASVASGLVHDGGHSWQYRNTLTAAHLFSSDPLTNGGTPSDIRQFNNMIIDGERRANATQTRFLNAVPRLTSHIRNHLTGHINRLTNAELLSRYRGR